MTLEQAKEKLAKYGQEHVLKYYDELSEEEKKDLLEQIEATDMSILDACRHKEDLVKKGVITPLAAMELPEIAENREQFTALGLDAIRAGKVGAVLLAGGMGTRLGSDGPKGIYNIGITKKLYIFECLVNNLMEVVKQADTWIHLFVMTSDKNHETTMDFLQQKNYFGYNAEYVHFFKQEMAAATDYEGKIYLEEKGKLSTSPNGNGGWFVSMEKNGMLDIVHEAGIEWLNVFAVDNVLQRIADPCFVGAVIQKKCAVGAKVVRKNARDEKVGVMCLEDSRPSIVEYYELTDEMMDAKDEKGEPAYNFGVILNYLFRETELEKLAAGNMPLHIVEKKIPCLDEQGKTINPENPNGYKYENLVLDMIHQMDSCLPFEVVRNKEFAPIKNATGVDSVESARKLLEENGIEL
ncbi:MAG: UTP--glucose-1-phosphate uridylyltransferase [Bacteroidales bacterium]|nr:UTP--glucose-1-phosphate uridylyltransferase [Lachnoclostridium sp.]MCM1383707.1 UTP--glucose-1-phosphate uridylyltransferase [Lachnoclostridium sp.]MCM1464335.1 UTP--glucose-1-phosphate uridylyltransferase [Bacteroidales bacterium]